MEVWRPHALTRTWTFTPWVLRRFDAGNKPMPAPAVRQRTHRHGSTTEPREAKHTPQGCCLDTEWQASGAAHSHLSMLCTLYTQPPACSVHRVVTYTTPDARERTHTQPWSVCTSVVSPFMLTLLLSPPAANDLRHYSTCMDSSRIMERAQMLCSSGSGRGVSSRADVHGFFHRSPFTTAHLFATTLGMSLVPPELLPNSGGGHARVDSAWQSSHMRESQRIERLKRSNARQRECTSSGP